MLKLIVIILENHPILKYLTLVLTFISISGMMEVWITPPQENTKKPLKEHKN